MSSTHSGSAAAPPSHASNPRPVTHGKNSVSPLPNPVALKIAMELEASKAPSHWRADQSSEFTLKENALRELNRNAARVLSGDNLMAERNDLFLSHCWRDQATQEHKMRLVCELSRIREVCQPPAAPTTQENVCGDS